MLAEIVKSALVPGSTAFLLLGLAAGVTLLYLGKAGSRLGRRWLTALVLAYVVLALPAVSNALIAGLEPDFPTIVSRDDVRGARALVVLGNGVVTYATREHWIHQFARRTAHAVLEGARLYTLTQPDVVIASGGIADPSSQRAPESEVIRDELVRLGVPRDRILLESASRNTREQMANVAQLARAKSLAGPLVLVTTPAHARRALMLARREGLDIVPSMADTLRYDSEAGGWRNWLPTIAALRGSESAAYEYLAVAYDWLRGLRSEER